MKEIVTRSCRISFSAVSYFVSSVRILLLWTNERDLFLLPQTSYKYYRGSVWLGGAFASEINLQPLAKTRGKFLRIGLISDFTCP